MPLPPRQQRAIAAILAEPSADRAAAAAGVSPRTLRRWAAGDDFRDALGQAQREAFAGAMRRLQVGAIAAADRLVAMLADPSAPAYARVQAASVILRAGQAWVETDDLARRLEALERRLAAGGGP